MRPIVRDVVFFLPLLFLVGLILVISMHDFEEQNHGKTVSYSEEELDFAIETESVIVTERPHSHSETSTVAPIVEIPRETALLLSRRIPVEFDPMRKLACHQSDYTSEDCVSLATDFCGAFPAAVFICDVNLDSSLRDWHLNREGGLRFTINVFSDAILRGLGNEQNNYRLASYAADSVNLREAPELEAEYNLTRHVWHIYALARQTSFKPNPLWSLYQLDEVDATLVYRCLSEHLKVRALLEMCTSPEFENRVANHEDTRAICVERRVPSCSVTCWHTITDFADVRIYFWSRLKQHSSDWAEPAVWLALIPVEFNPLAPALAAAQPLQEDVRVVASDFADAMRIPSTYEVTETATFSALDRLSRALSLLSLPVTRALWPTAAAAIDPSVTGEALLQRARENGEASRVSQFWFKFFTASSVQQIVQSFTDLTASVPAAPPAAEEVEECPVCQMEGTDEITACGHRFHRRCLDQWFERRPTCPICRRMYPRLVIP